jgi:hypothetical protein
MLARLHERLANPPGKERAVAAAELRQITVLRAIKLVGA